MDSESKQSLAEAFSRYFSVDLAKSDDQKQAVFKIRYRVYCEEFKYKSAEDFPNGLETDEFDDFSSHCLITHKETGTPAGCVRLVPAIGPRSTAPLPFEKFCGNSLDQVLIDSMGLKRDTICEISRLAVDREFRRRSGESLTRFGEVNSLCFSAQEQRTFSLIAVSCFFAAAIMGDIARTPNGFAMMEPFLPRLMHRSGLDFRRVGKDIDYYGIRAPYFITYQSIEPNLQSDLSELFQWIRQSLIG